ncbi:hypothetical protein [Rhizobium leguminosarum]|uniref:hypothetical protein n=1 Tax=Rhizobium leguminosarum TaxID=384 RepID=UPI0015586EE7|nr:hypothetical protein [Rhizobium leguminosarum]
MTSPPDFFRGFFARSTDLRLNQYRFSDKIIQQFQVLQRPSRVFSDVRRCNPKIL